MKPTFAPIAHGDRHRPRHLAARSVPYKELSSQHQISADKLLRSRRHRGATTSGGDVGMDVDISCPTCGRTDWVQSVPAIRQSGVHTITGTDHYSGIGIGSTGLVPVFGSTTIEQTQTSNLAGALALAPPLRTSGRLVAVGLLLAIPFLLALPVTTAAVLQPPPDLGTGWMLFPALTVLACLATPPALMFLVAIRRVRRNNRIGRGASAAAPVWRVGQYCHGCGLCFWPFSPAPDVPARQSVSPHQFTWVVRNVGGYANI
ncbi:hypothetical protein [Nocardia nepalensis]|uniref:hypothetical protein n=1 Tax=Nocardia nepalensis TaxID=3375448 RepID=UPI003B671F1D